MRVDASIRIHDKRVAFKPIVIFLHIVLTILICLGIRVCYDYQISANSVIPTVSLFFVPFTFWLFWSWKKIANELFHPYILFLIAILLFNGSQIYLEAFHANQYGIMGALFQKEDVMTTVLFVIMGTSFLHLGALFAYKKKSEMVASPLSDTNIRVVGIVLFVISAIPSLIVLRNSLSLSLSSGYTSLYSGEMATGFASSLNILVSFLVPAAMFMLAGSKRNKKLILLSLVIILIYAMTQLVLGLRGYMAMTLIAYLWTWHKCICPIPRMFLLVGSTVMLVVVFPLVAIIRNVTGTGKFSFGNLVESFKSIDNPIVSIFTEMGHSMSTITYTMNLVPSQRLYDMGTGYYYALLTLIPNLFWDIHPSVAHGKYTYWLIEEVNPYVADAGGSIGYSLFAEAFINFGWNGTPLIVFLIGFLFVKLVSIGDSNNRAAIALVASFLAFSLFFARGESASIVRPLLWYAILPYLAVYALSKFEKKQIKLNKRN